VYNEGRYTMLTQSAPEAAALLLADAQKDVVTRWKLYEYWASMPGSASEGTQAS
jgi:pyruvate-ferredoxin/flavodoxin oxidoreductase